MKCVTAGVFVVCVCMCEDFRTSVPLKQWLQQQSSVLHFLYVSLSLSPSLSQQQQTNIMYRRTIGNDREEHVNIIMVY